MRVPLLLLACLPVLACPAQLEKKVAKVTKALQDRKPYQAIRVCNAVLSDEPDEGRFLVLRAQANNRISSFYKAMADADKAFLSGDVTIRAGAAREKGIAWYGLGNMDSAVVMLNMARSMMEDADVPYHLGLVRKANGETEQALALFEEAVKLEADHYGALRERGSMLALLGDSTGALRDLDRAIKIAPRDPVNHNSRGFYGHAHFGHHRRAIQDYNKAIKLNPNYGYAFNNRGWSRYSIGEVDKAVKDIRLAGRKNPENAYVQRNMGVIMLAKGNKEAACMHFKLALEMGFTQRYGDEVGTLYTEHCDGPAPVAPVSKGQAPTGGEPVKGNAPGGTERRGNAP